MEIYIVRQGDTLESIASFYNIPTSEIIRANNLQYPYTLTTDMALNIPVSIINIFDYYNIKQGDTLYSIAEKNNISVNNLSSINGLDVNEYIYPGQTILIPKPNVVTYIISMGDTLTKVAEFFNTTKQDIINNNSNIYLLPEQLIVLRKR